MVSGHFQFTVNGQIGDTVIIEASTNLDGPWIPIATNTLNAISLSFQDTDPANPLILPNRLVFARFTLAF